MPAAARVDTLLGWVGLPAFDPGGRHVAFKVEGAAPGIYVVETTPFENVTQSSYVRIASVAGTSSDESDERISRLIGFASPNDMQALRQYPTGYRHYLQTAPANLIGAWDVLEGLAAGVTHPDATRYFMTIPEAARLVLQAAAIGNSGQVLLLALATVVSLTPAAQSASWRGSTGARWPSATPRCSRGPSTASSPSTRRRGGRSSCWWGPTTSSSCAPPTTCWSSWSTASRGSTWCGCRCRRSSCGAEAAAPPTNERMFVPLARDLGYSPPDLLPDRSMAMNRPRTSSRTAWHPLFVRGLRRSLSGLYFQIHAEWPLSQRLALRTSLATSDNRSQPAIYNNRRHAVDIALVARW